jgi:hypothetical protein
VSVHEAFKKAIRAQYDLEERAFARHDAVVVTEFIPLLYEFGWIWN